MQRCNGFKISNFILKIKKKSLSVYLFNFAVKAIASIKTAICSSETQRFSTRGHQAIDKKFIQ
jgi:hypothetical protein